MEHGIGFSFPVLPTGRQILGLLVEMLMEKYTEVLLISAEVIVLRRAMDGGGWVHNIGFVYPTGYSFRIVLLKA